MVPVMVHLWADLEPARSRVRGPVPGFTGHNIMISDWEPRKLGRMNRGEACLAHGNVDPAEIG